MSVETFGPDEPVDVLEVVRRAHRRLGRRAAATLVGGLAVSALLGLGGEGVRRAVHDPTTTTTTTTTPPVVLGAPTLTGGATGPRTARLSWTEPDGSPVRYVLYRDGAARRTVTERRFDDAGLVPGRSYSYAVEALDADGKRSARSKPVTVTTPAVDPPSNLTARPAPGSVALLWEPSSDEGVVAYLVFRDGAQLDRLDAGTLRYVDRTVEQVTAYEYEVRAVDGAGNRSLPASVAITTPDAEPPTAPQGLDVAVRQGDTELRWRPSTDNVGVAGYEIRREGKAIGEVGGGTTTFVDKGAHFDQEYTVVAVDEEGNRSKPSEPASEGSVD